jgi:hypothetical protein
MKLCALCGASAADDAAHCASCGEATFVAKTSTHDFVAKLAPVVVSEDPPLVAEPSEPVHYQMKRSGKGKR